MMSWSEYLYREWSGKEKISSECSLVKMSMLMPKVRGEWFVLSLGSYCIAYLHLRGMQKGFQCKEQKNMGLLFLASVVQVAAGCVSMCGIFTL